MNYSAETLGQETIWLVLFSFFLVLGIMFGLLFFGYWVSKKRGSLSPYSGRPMMLGVDLPISIAKQVEGFLESLPQPENPSFEMDRAAICRETGRIFPNVVNKGEIIRLNWRFLVDRCPGNWVSWGSLSQQLKAVIKLHHRDIEGFQLEKSCPNRLPQDVEPYYAMMKPGPLYVDSAKKTFLGWQVVPGTHLEVLVVKKPDFESIDEIL